MSKRMLTRKELVGPWAGLPVAWNDDFTFDEKTYRGDVASCCEAGVPGVYTGGTTGEFYALEFAEFKAITNATIQECGNGHRPVMIGCTSTFTLGAIRRAQYAAEKGADAIQIALPFWMEVPDMEVVRFFREISDAVPGMPITIYETLRSKKAVSVQLHREIHREVPAIIGVKSNEGTVGRTKEGCSELAGMYNVFVGESSWYELGPHGAVGSCSSLVYQNPGIVLKTFDLVMEKNWSELKKWTDKFTRLIVFIPDICPILRRI